MKRLFLIWTVLIAAAIVLGSAAGPALAQGGEGDGEHEGGGEDADQAALYGAAIYAEFCQACHGPQGEARADGPAFVAIEYDAETTRAVIADGQDSDDDDGVAMPPYAQTSGGPLSEAQLDELMAYMATWGSGEVPALPAPNLHPDVERVPDYFGDLDHGAALYATTCYGCHGAEGEGRVPPNFPAFEYEPDAFSHVMLEGAESPYMPAFAAESGGPLDETAREDLATYLASWDVEEEEAGPSPEGWSTFLVILGVLSILAVGGAYMANTSFSEIVGLESDDEDEAR